MTLVEQAIYTSLDTASEAGYHVTARSPGVCDADARELAVWEPSADAMLEAVADAESFNFHPLPSGAYCISRSLPSGWEHGGVQRIHTHCLIVPPEVLARFANNPFAVIQTVTQHDLWQNPHTAQPQLASFALPGSAAVVDQKLLHELAQDPGPQRMAALIQQACRSLCLVIGGTKATMPLISGLLNCLPVECRLEFSFSTGLRFSPWRPFRLGAITNDTAERLWVASYSNTVVLELVKDAAVDAIHLDGWARFVERAMSTDNLSFLASQIAKRRFELTMGDLSALGLQLLESLDCPGGGCDNHAEPILPANGDKIAHAAHQKFSKSRQAGAAAVSDPPSIEHTGAYSREVLEKLETLDDLVYDAISGQSESLEQLRTLWPKLFNELGNNVLLAESREQYLRYALSIWNECSEGGAIRDPSRAIQALDVLCLLFDE